MENNKVLINQRRSIFDKPKIQFIGANFECQFTERDKKSVNRRNTRWVGGIGCTYHRNYY